MGWHIEINGRTVSIRFEGTVSVERLERVLHVVAAHGFHPLKCVQPTPLDPDQFRELVFSRDAPPVDMGQGEELDPAALG